MKEKFNYLRKISITKILMFSYIFIMSLFMFNVKVGAKSIEVNSSTYKGNSKIDTPNAAKNIHGIPYIQGHGISNKDGITFTIKDIYNNITDFTAMAVWEQGFSSSAGSEYEDYDRWYIEALPCSDNNYPVCQENIVDNQYVVKDEAGKIISHGEGGYVYYIIASINNKNMEDAPTVVDFSKFFTEHTVTYTYRIRNLGSANKGYKESFGFKEIHINFWKSNKGEESPDFTEQDKEKTLVIQYGLAKPISDVKAYTNYADTERHSIACNEHEDEICIDYVDSSGVPDQSTTASKEVNIYMPNTVAYNHVFQTMNDIKDSYLNGGNLAQGVIDGNTIFGLNYFCEGKSIVPANIMFDVDNKHIPTCDPGTGELREYLYVNSQLKSKSMQDVNKFNNGQEYFIDTTYNATLTVDSRGNYVVIIRDVFGNTNETAVIHVMDIINQALLAYFEKSNAKENVYGVDGWKAKEYLTNQDVKLKVTMSATTVIKFGLPIKEATTTLLDSSYVKEIGYWRVSGNQYKDDICVDGNGEGCAIKPDDSLITKVYTSKGQGTDPITNEDFVSFEGNAITMNIHSNGRYRFYIETFSGNNTDNDGSNPVKGESKNPRVEIYKIDKSAPEIKFGGEADTKCNNGVCSHSENTFDYYQGTGSKSGSVINKLASVEGNNGKIQIDYEKNLIYYVSANGEKSVLASASDKDIFFTYLIALFNTQTYVSEYLVRHDNAKVKYSHTDISKDKVNYTLDYSNLEDLNKYIDDTNTYEDLYRAYIISNDIKYTAFSLASNGEIKIDLPQGVNLQQDNMKIEYLDGKDATPICDKLGTFKVDLNGDKEITQEDCVNYYLDHGIDFDIKITVYDVIEELVKGDNGSLSTKYVLGNETTRTIKVDVVDNTAPGFNSIINRENRGTDCRIELGNLIGKKPSDQDLDMIYNCYGITSEGSIYNFEDNVFKGLYTQEQTVNNRDHVSMYILSKETREWINLDEGYIPNRSGFYALFIVIRDDAETSTTFDLKGESYHDVIVSDNSPIVVQGNAIGLLASYYVDQKIVLVSPKENIKTYGEEDPMFEYCVSINKNTLGIKEYLDKPFKDMSVFTNIGCASFDKETGKVSLTEEVKKDLFKGNYKQADFTGSLTRQESLDYNRTQFDSERYETYNNYVGLYKIVLGSLDISDIGKEDGYNLGKDYIIKINPNERSIDPQLPGEARPNNKCNRVNTQIIDGVEVTGCYSPNEDDDYYVESSVLFTIKQTVLVVEANGSSKTYGDIDPNSKNYNKNTSKSQLTSDKSYLNGFTVVESGLKYNDGINVVLGVVRRQTGEDVGVYSVCNYRGEAFEDTMLETDAKGMPNNNMLIIPKSPDFTDCSTFDPYANTNVHVKEHTNGILNIAREYISSRALYIHTNHKDGAAKTLNVTDRERDNNFSNYVIEYHANNFKINPSKMYVQPTPGQRREYNYSGVDEVNPWELVVYGQKDFTTSETEKFNGYTANSPMYAIKSPNDPQSVDTSKDKLDQENYNNASEEREEWNLFEDNKVYKGFKTNETYSLFNGRISLKDRIPEDGVYKDMNAGWYMYNQLVDSSLNLITNGRKQCYYSNFITTTGTDVNYNQECRNYDLNIDLNYRNQEGYKNGDVVDGQVVEVVYKGKLGYCKNTNLGIVSDPDIVCDEGISSNILFEVYRREIILEFNSLLENVPSDNKDIVYGNRYDYYDTNLFKIGENTPNKDYLENHLFYCYASYEDGKVGISGDCTNNKWYGLTQGDSWVNVGLEFHMHKQVSSPDSKYYSTETDYAIPAGRYFIYSTINEAAKKNYKYNYLGGTLTIKTKTVGVSLTDYTKEYGNVYYDNEACLIKDGSLLNGKPELINDCLNVTNTKDNTYGFVIDGLDKLDTIKDNFIGRPLRDSNLDKTLKDLNGLQENVGIYDIKVGNIHSKNNNGFKVCNSNFIGDEEECVVSDSAKINNYTIINDTYDDLIYYLLKNGGDYSSNAVNTIVDSESMTLKEATLKINPATINITLTPNQTKMYGCSYNATNTTSIYGYNYESGYDCIETTGQNFDLGYGYTVTGDKDYYIYNYGYYDKNYDYDTSYTTNGINQINKNGVIDALLQENAKRQGNISSALNGGVLYRVNFDLFKNSLDYNTIVQAANNAQAMTHYQGQGAGNYVITLGNLNATLTSEFTNTYKEDNNKVCGVDNLPGNGSEICRNYIIDYYNNTSVDTTHTYNKDLKSDTTFKITPRVAFIYAEYNSKVYGNNEPNITVKCTREMVEQGICENEDQSINVGLTKYYTKYNSLAKAPYVASIDKKDGSISFELTNKNDKQIDVVTGRINRIGMNNKPSQLDDIVGTYNYIYDDVVTTGYASSNYNLNYYYRQLDAHNNILIKDGVVDESTNPYILDTDNFDQTMAVNEHGKIDALVDDVAKKVYFEINLRKITVTLVPFAKTYGIEDNKDYFDLGVCASVDQILGYDTKGNPICSFAPGVESTDHGLSPSHLAKYVKDGILNQSKFKEDFHVEFVRSLGENVKCPGKNVTGTIHGFFTDRTKEFTYDLGCQDGFYQALGIINQSSRDELGYNYEITYQTGTMEIVKRTIEVIPDADQGFQYGSYTYPTLIPSIRFTNELKNSNYNDETKKVVTYSKSSNDTKVIIVNRDGTIQDTDILTNPLGLVSNNNESRICLNNIDGVNKFCINDKQDTYDVDDSEGTTSEYHYNEDGVDAKFETFVFSDIYKSELSNRSALNRKINDLDNQRYNRNVGTYTITLGDLSDHSGNYIVKFKEGVTYTITPAKLNITPDSNQTKIYGESDKEIKFKMTTTYTVNSSQYVIADESIVSIVDSQGKEVTFSKESGKPIYVLKGSTITLSGFAYYENSDNNNYNYGKVKNSNKSNSSASVPQTNVVGESFDKYCYDNYIDNSTEYRGAIEGCKDKKVSFESTTLILVGYLHVDNYAQRYGTYKIVNGMLVSDNEFNNQNYDLSFKDDVTFEIKKLDINLYVNKITKTYGEATDSYKCEFGIKCEANGGILTAQDNESMLEYNFDISYKNNPEFIKEAMYDSSNEVLMVNAINNNYYTQSEGKEDKNNFLGVNVIRKNNNSTKCSVSTDKYGCEDAGEYDLTLRKFEVTLKDIKDGSNRYDDNYNLMVNNVDIKLVDSSDEYVIVNPLTHDVESFASIKVIDELIETLTINKKDIDIFVNTNLNDSEDNYYEIEQNVEVPSLPTIDNTYDLINYKYDENGVYHGLGESASSKSDNDDLDTTYTKIVWGNHPNQVRVQDALVGQVAYCNQPTNGSKYLDKYPVPSSECINGGQLVYDNNKGIVNTSVKDKFILITRDTLSDQGLKILPTDQTSNINNNNYENKNYNTTFYPGAVHVVGDEKDPVLNVGNKDYYIEANAKVDGNSITGSYTSIGTILEYLSTITKENYILAKVDKNGNLYISIPGKDVIVTSASLWENFGSNREGYKGIVSGLEQRDVYPFVSDFAHNSHPFEGTKEGSYLNETNIKMLEELITTFIKWFDVTSYDAGQYLNGQYLPRKFDKYYYIAINENGYDIGNDVDNKFAINKVGIYNISFYVMDNSGRISKDGNIGRLHIIDTTAPELGNINLYNTQVKCDKNCSSSDSWYINASEVRFSSFNRYRKTDDDQYVLDSEGEYIYFAEVGNDSNPYVLISSLDITIRDYVKYINLNGKKYLAEGVRHYSWDSSPNGIYLVITGGRDNSYTVKDNSSNSQWTHYYSLDGGNYWIEYKTYEGMEGYRVLFSDGVREIKIMTMDFGVSISDAKTTTYEVSYKYCYDDCPIIDVINKVNIGGTTKEFKNSKIENSYFMYDASTKCTINMMGTLITCKDATGNNEIKLEGNRFTFKGINYVILGDNVLTATTKEFKAKVVPMGVTIDGFRYRYDPSSGMLYRDHYGRFKDATDTYVEIEIDGLMYQIVGNQLRYQGNEKAIIENGRFTLNGLTYVYIVDASKNDYYYAVEGYKVYQDSFVIRDSTYRITDVGEITIGGNTIVISKHGNYTNSYSKADRFLKGITITYSDSVNSESSVLKASEAIIDFNINVTQGLAWNKASEDKLGHVDKEVSDYLNASESNLYYQDRQTAYLDTTAPTIGIVMNDSHKMVSYGDGDKLFTYEFGYYNTTKVNKDGTYRLRDKVFTINKKDMIVTDPDGLTHPISKLDSVEAEKQYSYEINYVTYYLDTKMENVSWLPAYVEKYVGGKDISKGGNINPVEIPLYDVRTSVMVGGVNNDTIGAYRLMNEINTNTDLSSGIGSNKFKTSGTNNLYDFIYLGEYQSGIYYEDIDYIVSYVFDEHHNEINLNEQFKKCYQDYTDSNGDHMITQDCAQSIIKEVISPRGNLRQDITYDIMFVIRDKAGNPSPVVAKGVIYATIFPSTNVIISDIPETETNSRISVKTLGENTYSVDAFQGVSSNLLNQAFKVDYTRTSNYQSYNDDAYMTIYKDDVLIQDKVQGVNFTDYIDSNEIAEYKIVYNMQSKYTPAFGDDVDINGDEVTLYLSINSPKVDVDNNIDVNNIVNNNSFIIGIVMGVILLITMGVFITNLVMRRKRK